MFCSRRSKRIAHPKQYKNYLQEARQFDYMQVHIGRFRDQNKLCTGWSVWINPVTKLIDPQNAVNVDTLTDDMLPSQSQVFDKYFDSRPQIEADIQIHESNC